MPGLSEGVGMGGLLSSWLLGVKTGLTSGRGTGLGGQAVGPIMLAGRTWASHG